MRESLYTPPVPLSKLVEIEGVLGEAIRGKPEVLRLSLACLLARGHLLIEDVPGVGKTTLAQALARCVQASFHRLPFTSDMLPSAGLFSPIASWPTKSIAPRRRRSRPCSKR